MGTLFTSLDKARMANLDGSSGRRFFHLSGCIFGPLGVVFAALLLLGVVACGDHKPAGAPTLVDQPTNDGLSKTVSEVTGRTLPPPAGLRAMAPSLVATADGVLLSWLEPVGEDTGEHQFLMAELRDGLWSRARLIHSGPDFFANWADVPGLAVHPDGSWIAHWLEKTSSETYSYGIELARSLDAGETWQRLGKLNDDTVDGEHGFVSYAAEGESLRAFWLDGREMIDEGPMTLRSALIDGGVSASERVVERVCECCPTAAATGSGGTWVAYRGRSEEEVRDIFVASRQNGMWNSPQLVSENRWQISGCPVNGPAVDALDVAKVIAWFSAPAGEPVVQAAFDSGTDGFGSIMTLAEGELLGRVDVVLTGPNEAAATWLSVNESRASLQLARFDRQGRMGEPVSLALTTASRASGYPELERVGDRLFVAWVETEDDQPAGLSLLELPVKAVPAPTS